MDPSAILRALRSALGLESYLPQGPGERPWAPPDAFYEAYPVPNSRPATPQEFESPWGRDGQSAAGSSYNGGILPEGQRQIWSDIPGVDLLYEQRRLNSEMAGNVPQSQVARPVAPVMQQSPPAQPVPTPSTADVVAALSRAVRGIF